MEQCFVVARKPFTEGMNCLVNTTNSRTYCLTQNRQIQELQWENNLVKNMNHFEESLVLLLHQRNVGQFGPT